MADEPAAPEAAPAPPTPRPRRGLVRRLLPWLLFAVVALPLMAALIAWSAWRSLHTESGTRWWLQQAQARVPGLRLGTPSGALIGAGSTFSIDSGELTAGRTIVRIDGLRLVGLQIDQWQTRPPFVRVRAGELAARRVDVALGPPPQPEPPPSPPPGELRIPLTLAIDRVRVDTLALPGLPAPIEGLAARVEAGDTHRLDDLSLRWNGLLAEGSVRLGAAAPLPLDATLALRSDGAPRPGQPLPPWARDLTLQAQARGPLTRFDLQAALAMQDQRFDVKAQVTPFDALLPVSQLDARFAQLDLARLLAPLTPLAPTTDLTGNATVQLNGDRPLVVRAQARNAKPDRWDRRGLPLRELDVIANGRGTDWRIERAVVELASDARTPAGRLSGSGRYDVQQGRGEATLALDGLLLQGLDERAPPLRLSGPIQLKHLPGAPSPPPPAAAGFGRIEAEARLTGSLVGAAARKGAPAALRESVQLTLRGHATASEIVAESLSARAGKARLDGRASARRDGSRWATEADLKLAAFDPAQWMPGAPSATLRRTRNALNGSASLRARVPADASGAPALLAALQGTLRAELADSVLAGQPVALSLQAQADGAGLIDATGEARAGNNDARLALRLRAPGARGRSAQASGGDERLELRLDAPALERLAPLADALGIGPLAGAAQLDARAEGALGARLFGAAQAPLTTQGTAKLESLQAGTLRLASASAEWNATLPPDEPGAAQAAALARATVQARLQAADVALPGLLLPSVSLQADGTLAQHRATLAAQLRQAVPPGGEAAAGPPPAPLSLDATLQGGWSAGRGNEPNAWRATIEQIALRPVPGAASGSANGAAGASGSTTAASAPGVSGSAPGAPSGTAASDAPLPLFVASRLQVLLQHGPAFLRAALEPGQADVLGASLRWSTLSWERRGSDAPKLAVQAEVEPFAVTQVLQRLQPEFGWAGDLRIGARARIDGGDTFKASVEVARTGGDLQVSELGNVQALGLTDARLALEADGGVWRLSQLIAGANLGRVEGRQTVRADPRAPWPAPDAAVEGQIGVQVENLAAWGAWVPAGWRLGGQFDAALRVAGRFGSPELIGEARGRALSLRNTLEGVALADGEIDARFEGGTASLTRLRFQAGQGEVQASGEARLGATPSARLQLSAKEATILGRVDRRVVTSGEATVRLEADKIDVEGDFRVDSGLVDISRGDAPSLGDDVSVRRNGDPDEAAEADAARRTPRALDLRLGIDLGSRFRLRGRGIDTRLTGRIDLTTPNGRLTANGEIRTDRGTYEAYGQKLDIERGVITFVGSVDNPRLDIEAVRANSDVRVGVRVSGNVVAPRVALFSDPELPATEKLALLVTGRSYDSLAGSEAVLLQRAAIALLAGDGSGGGGLDPAALFRLDELSVRQSDGATRDTIVTLGKQLSDRVYVGYERGLNATAGNWQLIYRIAQRFTLRAQSGEDSALDLIWLFRWN